MKTMKGLFSTITAMIVAIGIIGCGGSSTGGNAAPTARTKSNVAQHFSGMRGFQSGMALGAGPTANRSRMKSRSSEEGSTNGGSVGGGGGGIDLPPPSIFFDSWTELWVKYNEPQGEGALFSADYFEDEAASKPAGRLAYAGDGTNWSFTFDITKGPKTGLTGRGTATWANGLTSSKYDWFIPGEGTYTSDTKVTEDPVTNVFTYSAKSSYENADKSYSMRTESSNNAAGDFVYTTSDSLNYSSTFTWKGDGTGMGSINGPDAGLPATLNWNQNGDGQIRWADGSVTNFTGWDFFGQFSRKAKNLQKTK